MNINKKMCKVLGISNNLDHLKQDNILIKYLTKNLDLVTSSSIDQKKLD